MKVLKIESLLEHIVAFFSIWLIIKPFPVYIVLIERFLKLSLMVPTEQWWYLQDCKNSSKSCQSVQYCVWVTIEQLDGPPYLILYDHGSTVHIKPTSRGFRIESNNWLNLVHYISLLNGEYWIGVNIFIQSEQRRILLLRFYLRWEVSVWLNAYLWERRVTFMH